MQSEADVRFEIDEALKNKGWILCGKNKNVFAEKNSSVGRADYVLKPKDRENPLVIIEAKRKGRDLNEALRQAQKYAEQFKSPIAYASDGSTIKTIHLKNLKPLILNGEEIDEFVSEALALQYFDNNEYNTIGKQIIKSRKELINIFVYANKELRKEGLQAGIERFSEFCNILFLKIFSEEENARQEQGIPLRIPKEFNWNYFKNKDGNELLYYVNDTVLKNFQREYGTDIFAPLQLKNPLALKKIIDSLDPLSLVDTNSDIKGDAFEYFLKAYLSNQNKDLGEYFTPRHIVKTLVKLVNPKFGETVYDPFCGTGGILIESFRHIYNKMPRNEKTLEQLKKETIYGSEITKNARITKMNMILAGDGHNNIIKQDSLKNPTQKKYDVVITNMPFSLGSYDEYAGLYKLGSSNGNSLCIEHCFNAIDVNSENPRIGIIIPEGILFDRKFKKLREHIYKKSYVKDIVSLPSGAFKPYTDVKTSILYLTQVNQSNKTQKSVWHYTVKNDGYTLNTKRQKKEGENDLELFLSFNDVENENNLLHIGFNKLNLKEVKNNDYISIPNPYRKFEFNSNFKNVPLGQLIEKCELKNRQNANVWSITNDKGFVLAEERFDEKVASENTTKYKIILPNAFAYNPSRINVGSIAFNNSGNVGCVSPMYLVFKVSDDRLLSPKYLYWLLKSEQFKQQINSFSVGSVRQIVSFSDFCKIQIPLPSLEEQKKIVDELDSYHQIVESITSSIRYWKPYFEIDKNWKIIKIGDYIETKYGYTAVNNNRGDFRYLRTTDISDSFTLKNKPVFINTFDDIDNFLIKKHDVFITRSGSVGKSFIALEDMQAVFASYLVRLRFNQSFINPLYFLYYSNTDNYWSQVGKLTDVLTQPNLNAEKMKMIEMPLPPLHIQQEIVGRLEQEHKMIDSQKEIINLFEAKIQNKLNSIWQTEEENELVADKETFDTLIKAASKPLQS